MKILPLQVVEFQITLQDDDARLVLEQLQYVLDRYEGIPEAMLPKLTALYRMLKECVDRH